MHTAIFITLAAIIATLKRKTFRNMKLKKGYGDLLANPGRTLLVIFALVIGLWGVGTILVSFYVLKRDLNANFLRTVPAHAEMVSDDFDRLDLSDFRKWPEIDQAEFRDLSILRVEAYPDQWLPLLLYGVKDFKQIEFAKFYHERGKEIPDPGTILIERDALQPTVSNLKIGSTPRVRIRGKNETIPISGIAFDPAQAPATQDAFIYGYTDQASFAGITGEAINRRLIVRLKNVSTKKEVESVCKTVLERLKKRGITIRRLTIPKFNEHPHQFQLNTLLMINGLIGFLAFFMGTVLVSQLMGALLSQQIRQIGIMKAIGASRFDVFEIYLLMVMIMGGVASAIAIPLAVVSGYGYAGFVAKILNFDILTTSLPSWIYWLMIASGVFLPVVMSFGAIRRGANVSVYAALRDYGIREESTRKEAKSPARFPFSPLVRLALRNTLRRKKRVLVTVLAMTLGVAIFSTGFNVKESLIVFLAKSRDSMRYDVQVVLSEKADRMKALAPFRSLDGVERIETWSGGKGRLQTNVIATTGGIGIVALPRDTDLMNWDVIEGRWLAPSQEIEIVMNQRARENLGMPVTGKIFPIGIGSKTVQARLVGIVKEFDVAKIYIDRKDYDSIANPDHAINSLMFVSKQKGYDQIIDFKKRIESAITASDLDILYVMSQAERARIIYDHLNIILSILAFLAFLVLVVGALGMASAMGINILERTREIGVMRAIGATSRIIYRMFLMEGMFVVSISIVAGLLLSFPMSLYASRFFGALILGESTSLDFAFSQSGFVITLLVTLSFGWIAGRFPARSGIAVSTREALSYE